MDPVTEKGLAASVASLVDLAYSLLHNLSKHPQLLRCSENAEPRQHLQRMLESFIRRLQSAGSGVQSREVSEYTRKELKELRAMIVKSCSRCPSSVNCVWSCVCAADVHADLVEAEHKLINLRKEVLVVHGMVVLRSHLPIVCDEKVEIPLSDVGLDRTKKMLEFLERSQHGELRVICIYGRGGLGKTTLLNKMWHGASSKSSFAARAYVQFGHEVGPETVCNLQSSILEQLGGGKQYFPSDAQGRRSLKEHFQNLRSCKRPIFLAVDNILEQQVLRNLLPSKIASLLPPSSCIAVTSRDKAVVDVLLDICHLQESNQAQVLCYTPPLLAPGDSKALFYQHANIATSRVKHAKLLEELVSLCEGIPLALTVMGGIFNGDESMRDTRKQKDLIEELKSSKGPSVVDQALQLSFQRLPQGHKESFLDVVHFFYGCPWERVERVVGRQVLEDLKNKSLLSEVKGYSKCNQKALRMGYEYLQDPWPSLGVFSESLIFTGFFENFRVRYLSEKAVTMHDLTFKLGENYHSRDVFLVDQDNIENHGTVVKLEDYASLGEAGKLRHLMLLGTASSQQIEILKEAVNLQTLVLITTEKRQSEDAIVLQAGKEYFDALPGFPLQRQLRYLRLEKCKSSRLILELMLSTETREIYLRGCHDVAQLPEKPELRHLEQLEIIECSNFQSFPKCLKEWHNLKVLIVQDCSSIIEIPIELGNLPSLRLVACIDCPRLEKFPLLCHADGPYYLLLSGCPSLRTLPDMSCPLQSLVLHSLPIAHLCNFSWEFLEELSLINCHDLEMLPTSICGAPSLRVLHLEECSRLKSLPDEIGKLQSLIVLEIKKCSGLERLPSAIGSAQSLLGLQVSCCRGLVELPDEIGKLTSLWTLDVSQCKLERLPQSICNMSSLRRLTLDGCESLVELPKGIGSLTSLEVLDARGCKKLERLPESIFNISSLQTLQVDGCERLVELPKGIEARFL